MGFSIVPDFTNLGAVALVLVISAALLVLIFLITAANRARHDVTDDDPDAPIM